MTTVPERLVRLETRMSNVEDGVNNFRTFQLDIKSKMAFVYGAAWAWSVIFSVILAAMGYALHEMAPAVKALMLDYYLHHPGSEMHEKSLYAPSAPVLSYSQQTTPEPETE
jgi:hypothetical protein